MADLWLLCPISYTLLRAGLRAEFVLLVELDLIGGVSDGSCMLSKLGSYGGVDVQASVSQCAIQLVWCQRFNAIIPLPATGRIFEEC
jgi:hypothetical protein